MSLLLALLACVPWSPSVDAIEAYGARTQGPFEVHEWGTFTAVAGEDGAALDWRPLVGPSELPDFVWTVGELGGERDGAVVRQGKEEYVGTVRMETPVLYFYAPAAMNVSVAVDFPDGKVTEWFPAAHETDHGGVDWGTFEIVPPNALREAPHLEIPERPTRYETARAVPDAAFVRLCRADADPEWERFLFYRGVGRFDLSLKVRLLDDGRLDLTDATGAIGTALVYANDGALAGVRAVSLGSADAIVDPPALDQTVDHARESVRALLRTNGLTDDEADAMLATWQSDWFEPGLRAIYVVPRAEVDRLLPLHVEPVPDTLVRVLVGRVEVITPTEEAATRALLDAADSDADALVALRQARGRFAEPVLRRLASQPPSAAQARARRLADAFEAGGIGDY